METDGLEHCVLCLVVLVFEVVSLLPFERGAEPLVVPPFSGHIPGGCILSHGSQPSLQVGCKVFHLVLIITGCDLFCRHTGCEAFREDMASCG